MTKYMEVEMSKQSSIEWLFDHLVPHLNLSKFEDRELFRKLKAEAKQMYENELREERIATYDKILNKLNGKGEN